MALFKTSNIPKDYEYVLCFKTDNKYLKSLYNTKSEYLYSNKHKGNTHKDSGFDLYIPEIETIPAGEIKILDLDVKLKTREKRKRPKKSEVTRLFADSSKAKEILDWSPKVTLDEGLLLTINWIKKNMENYNPKQFEARKNSIIAIIDEVTIHLEEYRRD